MDSPADMNSPAIWLELAENKLDKDGAKEILDAAKSFVAKIKKLLNE